MCVFNIALTANNIINLFSGKDWETLGIMLSIPITKLNEIAQKYSTSKQREVAVVRYWLLRDPLASWRRIIVQLDRNGKHEQADRIRHYAEELTGTCMIYEYIIYITQS